MKHMLDTNIASKFGVNVALFLEHLHFWTFQNLVNNRNLYDGLCWTYNSLDAFLKIFPYWSKQNLETVIKRCISEGLIAKGNYNQNKYDRTCWYALTPYSYHFFDDLLDETFFSALYSTISENQEIDLVEFRNRFPASKTPIPDIKPISDTNTKHPISPKGEVDRFQEFWEMYPNKIAKKACYEKWRRLKLDLLADEIFIKLREQIIKDESWIRGYAPNPLTFLTQERWNDEIKIISKKITQNGSSHQEYDDDDTSWIEDMKL